jgi:hypothetical protein
MNTTTPPLYFSIDSDYVVGANELVFMSIVSKEYRLKTAMDIEKHPRLSRELSKRWRLIGVHKHMTLLDKVVYDLEIRKYKSSWALITRSKIDNQPILLKLVKQKINKIEHPCLLGKCEHVKDMVI